MSSLPLFEKTALTQAPPPKSLRPYQSRAIINIRALVMQGKRRILCVAPTGAGKLFVTATIIKSATLPVLFVAHRKEILDQCASQLADQGITNIGVIRANDERFNPYASVQIGSISTLARRDRPFLGKEVIVIIDEAHRAASDSYRDLLAAYDNPIVLGFTATPVRLDGRPLGGDLFEEIVIIATYEELLKRRDWLVAPDVFAGREKVDVSRVRKSGADFDETELAQVMHTDRLEGNIVEHWLALAHRHPVFLNSVRVPQKFTEGERRRTILFAVNIEHSMSLAARFEKAGVRVAHLDGKTPENERENIFRDLASGQLEVVTNCQVAVEGLDIPEIKCVIHARPTHSQTMFRQTTGRCMRPWNDVTPLLLDHAGNFDRLGCPFEDLAWSLKEKARRFTSKMPMRLCPACFAYVEAARTICPFCGAELKAVEGRELPQETLEILQERQTEPEALQWAFFWRQVVKAKQFGFKPGFASAIFREHYGKWPPRHWSEKIKADFSVDPMWQAALERRLERKAQREERERQEEQALSEEESAMEATIEAMDSDEVQEDDESFGDWLKEQGIE